MSRVDTITLFNVVEKPWLKEVEISPVLLRIERTDNPYNLMTYINLRFVSRIVYLILEVKIKDMELNNMTFDLNKYTGRSVLITLPFRTIYYLFITVSVMSCVTHNDLTNILNLRSSQTRTPLEF